MKLGRAFVLVCVVFLIGVLISGCGKREERVDKDNFATGETYAENGLPKDVPVTISAFFPVAGHGKEYFQYAVDTFMERFPNVKVNVRYFEGGYEEYNAIMKALIRGGKDEEMFDWALASGGMGDSLIIEGLLETQDELWERSFYDRPDLKLTEGLIVDRNVVVSRLDGYCYGLPLEYHIFGLFYNQGLFRQHGWQMQPAHWQEFMQLCEKIKQSGIYPMVMRGNAISYAEYIWNTIPFAVGGKEYEELYANYAENLYLHKAFLTKLERMAEFTRKGYLHPGTISFDHTQSQMEFIQGIAAMLPVGAWVANEMAGVIDKDFEWGFMTFPGNDPGQDQVLFSHSGTFGYIWKNRPELNKKWAKEFNLWLLNLDVQQKFSESGGIPVRKDLIETEEGLKNCSPSVAVALKALQRENVRVVYQSNRNLKITNAEMSKFNVVYQNLHFDIIRGDITPLAAAKGINDQYMKALLYEKKKQ